MTLKINNLNHTYLQIDASPEEMNDLEQYFSYYAENYKFSPRYKEKKWSGKIHLFSYKTGRIFFGLLPEIINFAEHKGYNIDLSDLDFGDFYEKKDIEKYLSQLKIEKTPYKYQITGLYQSILNKRALLIAPTGAGKSLMIYLIYNFLKQKNILIIVPTVSLVLQLKKDFEEYSKISFDNICNTGYSGQILDFNKKLTISTWQTLNTHNKKIFMNFDAVIVDEVHSSEAKVLKNIIKSCSNAEYRIGTTATLKNTNLHKMLLTGLFGPDIVLETTESLVKQKIQSKVNITALYLQHSVKKNYFNYHQEIDYLCNNSIRNILIVNLAKKLKGNTLILFNYVEKHGKIIFNELEKNKGIKNVYYISGEVKVNEREKIRNIVEKEDNSIICASFGTFQLGINIVRLHNIIITSPVKSVIRIKQSIGRGVRRNKKDKTLCNVYDIVDHIKYHNDNRLNYAAKHFKDRYKVYVKENYNIKIINLKKVLNG